MHYPLLASLLLVIGQTAAPAPGDYKRTITVDELKRVHWIHIPPTYDARKPTPVVLVLHGATMDGKIMEDFCGLDKTADRNGFITVYPNGTGPLGILQTWNSGVFPGELNKGNSADDVKYIGKVLDDVAEVVNVDPKRCYAAGLSNGGMMTYRLASEMSDRIAAIASVAGTMVVEKYEPKRPVPVLHIHGTKDTLVPFDGPENRKATVKFLRFRSVDETIQECVKANGCTTPARETEIDRLDDKTRVFRKEYPKAGAEVILYVIQNGGHVWPGSNWSPPFLGLVTRSINANDLIWDFFKSHTLK